MSPVDGLYVPFVGRNGLTNCSPITGLAIPTMSSAVYPLPGLTSFTFVTLPSVTVILAVAPVPDPRLFLSRTALYTPSLYPLPGTSSAGSSLDIPTLTVIVVAVSAVIVRVLLDAGSPILGYACSEAWLSASQVKVIPPSAIVTVLLVVKLWEPISITSTPVLGSYVVPDAAVNDPVAPPLAVIAFVTPLTNVWTPIPE